MLAMTEAYEFPVGGGETGALIRVYDWSRTSIGPIATWPQSLKTAVDLVLRSPVPLVMLWGRDGIMIYNDAYSVFAGGRHPALLGSKVLEGWPEVADLNRRVLDVCLAGQTLSFRNEHLVLYRPGRPKDVWVDLDYSPLLDESGHPAGVLAVVVETTDRILTEKALRASQAALARVQHIGKVGGLEVDLVDRFRSRRSPEYLVIHGLPPDTTDDGHEDWVRRLHPEDRQRAERLFLDTVASDARVYNAEYRIIRPSDGAVRWIALTAEIERDVDGRALRLVGAHIDVTDSKLAEQAIRESEQRFRLVSESAPVMLWMGDAEGKCLYLNRMLREFWGLPSEGIAEFDWSSALHPESRETLFAVLGTAMRDQVPFSVEAYYLRHDGEYRLLRTEAQPRFDATGAFLGMIGVNADITETRRAEQALEAQVWARTRERDRLWNVSQDMLVVADRNGIWQNVSPAATTMLGWRAMELIGKSSEWIEHADDAVRTRAETVHLAAGGITTRFENRIRHKDGSYRWLSWMAATHEDRIYAVARDITDEKEATETLRRTEEALRQSQKMEAVGQLTGGIAHDFNNLLQGIVGSLDLVQKRLADGRLGEIQRFINGAMTAANRAAALTHRLLAFSRRQPLDPKTLRVNPLIASMEDLLRRTIGERIELELTLAGDLWPTLCDQNQLENSILNLVINARDAMPGGGRLTIETANARLDQADIARVRDIAPGDYVSLTVTDSGTGMTPDVMARAFDPFFTTKPTGQGTGLGLSMVYGFARQSNGHVQITSEVGKGTAIRLYLPRHDAVDETNVDAEQPVGEHIARGGQTVLVIEDEPLVRMLVLDALDELGYNALEANDGPSGLRILQSPQRVDLLITDIGLPGLNGRQVADAARVGRPELKVLFMTGYAETAAKADGMLASGMELITKPFAMDALTGRIRDLMDAR